MVPATLLSVSPLREPNILNHPLGDGVILPRNPPRHKENVTGLGEPTDEE